MNRTVYIIDDEPSICVSLQLALKNLYRVKTFTSSLPALANMEAEGADIVLLDLRLGEENGLEVLERIKRIDPNTEVIMMTAFGSIDTSVNAMQKGAFTYLTKPINIEELKVIMQQASNIRKLNEQIYYLSDQLESKSRFDAIIGESAPMQRVYMLIDRVKDIDTNVLITGESGTGKELVARAIHNAGKRYRERFVVVNCAAIPENLLELEFFGYKRGAFTGAMQDKKGKLEQADNGTLFLDEIGDMPLGLQSKLLRALQDKEFTPVGGSTPIKVDTRILAATNRDLPALIAEGRFREDLYYRLNVMEIKLPPLRERQGDIAILGNYLLGKFSAELNKPIRAITPEAKEMLERLPYPGNVRQLANILEYACILCQDGVISKEDFPEYVTRTDGTGPSGDSIDDYLSSHSLKDIEKRAIEATLQRCGGKRVATAAQLGISKRGLLNKLKDKMNRKIDQTKLDATTRYELHTLLESMPKHSKVCHGDFNPSNIIIADEDGTPYILDWSHVTQGNASADVARTYLLFWLAGDKETAEKYLKLFCKKSDTARQYVEKWLPIVAASQSVKGKPEERELLLSWVTIADYE